MPVLSFFKGIIKMIITLLPERFKVIVVENSQYIFQRYIFISINQLHTNVVWSSLTKNNIQLLLEINIFVYYRILSQQA